MLRGGVYIKLLFTFRLYHFALGCGFKQQPIRFSSRKAAEQTAKTSFQCVGFHGDKDGLQPPCSVGQA